ncbi:MAG: type II toxin-antitoxin system RelE/ParE family toxin [Hyphomonadaceae bacterium]|nr:type II toxin-antitoxin system RelE/ParE family toxin [Hyphomonadaceae bacterium]
MKRLLWSSEARLDLLAIAKYHADPRVALLLLERIESAAERLRRFDTGRPGRALGTREKSVGRTRHVLVHEAHPDRIVVFRVVHMLRDWP